MSRWDAICCVVFDFDGTLVESNPIKRGVYFEILAETPGSGPVVETVLRENPGADRRGVLASAHEQHSYEDEARIQIDMEGSDSVEWNQPLTVPADQVPANF